MAPLNRVIIDTDPGVDDTLAMLLALAASPEEIEVLLLSVTYGNVEVESCLRNVVALFHVIEKELEWRRAHGKVEGFDTMKTFKPIIAVGAEHPLDNETLMADYFHGIDGLGRVHASHPHLSPSDTWKDLFRIKAAQTDEARELTSPSTYFTPSLIPANEAILNLLRENEPDTITIIAIGPLTNIALAAARDPETFLKVKELVVMGGAIDVKGNITPVAEFNTYADAVATARVFALTSPTPASTMPPVPPKVSSMRAYPAKLSRRLNLTLFPLDITTPHLLTKSMFEAKAIPLLKAGSPLAEWTLAFMGKTFDKINSLTTDEGDPGLSLHDPLCIWYILTRSASSWVSSPKGLEDIRIETGGQWTMGMHVVDRRNRRRAGTTLEMKVKSPGSIDISNPMESLNISGGDNGQEDKVPRDDYGWLSQSKGNRINRIISSPGEDAFAPYLLERMFGREEHQNL